MQPNRPNHRHRAHCLLGMLLSVALAAGCGTEPSPPGVNRVDFVVGSDPVHSGEPVVVTLTARAAGGAPVSGVDIVLEASDGSSVAPARTTTNASGSATVTWTTADRDDTQTLTARIGALVRSLSVLTQPHLTELSLGPADLTLQDFGQDVPLEVTGRTATNRVVTLDGLGAVTVVDETRTLDRLPVLVRAGLGFRSNGPGSVTLEAARDGIVSNRVTVTVPLARPVVLAPLGTAPLIPGGTVTLDGALLDAVVADAFRLDGAVAAIENQAAGTVTLRVPDLPAGCSGDALLALSVAGAWVPSPLTFALDRPGTVVLEPGGVAQLTEGTTTSPACLRLPPLGNAEYVLMYSDTRSVEAARTARESEALRSALFSIEVSDRTDAAPIGLTRVVAQPPSLGSDVRAGAARALGPPPSDWTGYRTAPWAVGDPVSVFINGDYVPGRVFHASPKLAFGIFDHDASLDIPGRLVDFELGIQRFMAHGVPTLDAAFGPEWPATTEAAGQTLVFFTPLAGAGGLAMILRHHQRDGVLNQDVVLLLNPGIGAGTGQLYFDWHSLTHEMAHAMQDRHALIRCRVSNDCLGDWFGFRWATEGGAELLKEEAIRRFAGLSRTGNYAPTAIDVINMYGFRSFWGDTQPHWDWGWGYSSTTFLLGFLLDRGIAAGGAYEDVLGALSRGSFEGWFGYTWSGTRRPGLQERLAPWLGAAWDPAAMVHEAAMAVAFDDIVPGPAGLGMPMVNGMARYFPQAATIVAGSGGGTAVTLAGDTFAHYRIEDRGRGGSYRIAAGVPGLRWALARVK